MLAKYPCREVDLWRIVIEAAGISTWCSPRERVLEVTIGKRGSRTRRAPSKGRGLRTWTAWAVVRTFGPGQEDRAGGRGGGLAQGGSSARAGAGKPRGQAGGRAGPGREQHWLVGGLARGKLAGGRRIWLRLPTWRPHGLAGERQRCVSRLAQETIVTILVDCVCPKRAYAWMISGHCICADSVCRAGYRASWSAIQRHKPTRGVN